MPEIIPDLKILASNDRLTTKTVFKQSIFYQWLMDAHGIRAQKFVLESPC
jgi:hypothetical protein